MSETNNMCELVEQHRGEERQRGETAHEDRQERPPSGVERQEGRAQAPSEERKDDDPARVDPNVDAADAEDLERRGHVRLSMQAPRPTPANASY